MIASKSRTGFETFEIPPISEFSKIDVACFADPPMSSPATTALFFDDGACVLPVLGLYGDKAISFPPSLSGRCNDGSESKPLTSIV
nr:hypothetical protein CFP56_37524 [Quercus suber]